MPTRTGTKCYRLQATTSDATCSTSKFCLFIFTITANSQIRNNSWSQVPRRNHGPGRAAGQWGSRCIKRRWPTQCRCAPRRLSIQHPLALTFPTPHSSSQSKAWLSTCLQGRRWGGRRCRNSSQGAVRFLYRCLCLSPRHRVKGFCLLHVFLITMVVNKEWDCAGV